MQSFVMRLNFGFCCPEYTALFKSARWKALYDAKHEFFDSVSIILSENGVYTMDNFIDSQLIARGVPAVPVKLLIHSVVRDNS